MIDILKRFLLYTLSRIKTGETSIHSFLSRNGPYGIAIAILGLVITFGTMIVDLGDREALRTFRAWEILSLDHENARKGSAPRRAVEYLNRSFDGFLCADWIGWLVMGPVAGTPARICIVPKKQKETFEGFDFRRVNFESAILPKAGFYDVDLTGANFSNADLHDSIFLDANLKNVNFFKTKLERVFLVGSNITGMKASGAIGLKQQVVDGACIEEGGEPPQLPEEIDPPKDICPEP